MEMPLLKQLEQNLDSENALELFIRCVLFQAASYCISNFFLVIEVHVDCQYSIFRNIS